MGLKKAGGDLGPGWSVRVRTRTVLLHGKERQQKDAFYCSPAGDTYNSRRKVRAVVVSVSVRVLLARRADLKSPILVTMRARSLPHPVHTEQLHSVSLSCPAERRFWLPGFIEDLGPSATAGCWLLLMKLARPASQVAVAMGLMAADESSTRSPSLSRPSPTLPGSQPASTSPGREAPNLQPQQSQVRTELQDPEPSDTIGCTRVVQ